MLLITAIYLPSIYGAQYAIFPIDELIRLIKEDNLLKSARFEEKKLNQEEFAKYMDQLEERKWIDQIKGLKEIYAQNLPVITATNEEGFKVSIHHNEGRILLLSIYAPVVNSSKPEIMMESMKFIASSSIKNSNNIEMWVADAMQKTWRYENKIFVSPIVQDFYDGYSLAMWGVPPDFFIMFIMTNEKL